MNKKKIKVNKDTGSMVTDNSLSTIESLLQNQSESLLYQEGGEPSEDAITRYGSIPLLFEDPEDRSDKIGVVAYDSWSQSPTPALRDVTDDHVRRLRLKAGKMSVEIVAERSNDRWEFVARAFRGGSVVHNFVLNVDQKRLLSESGGFFCWSSDRVPRRVSLISFEQSFSFEGLLW